MWKTSLTVKLTVAFTAILIALWLMIETVSYNNTYSSLLNKKLASFGEANHLQAQVITSLFNDAIEDVHRLTQLHRSFSKIGIFDTKGIVSRYFPFNNASKDYQDVMNMWFVQTFGSAGQHHYIDTFIIQPEKGITLYAQTDTTDAVFKTRVKALRTLSKQTSVEGIRWGEPIWDEASKSYNLSFSYSERPNDPHALQIGFTINFEPVIGLNSFGTMSPEALSFFLIPNGKVFSLSPEAMTKGKLAHFTEQYDRQNYLMEGHLNETDFTGFHVIKERIKGPDWLQVTLISNDYVKQIALAPIFRELPWALISLFVMLVIVLMALRYHVAKPLGHFVDIITNDVQDTLDRRLPASSTKELDQIATAYNRLLDTIKENYNNLEKEIERRTLELGIAKLKAEKATERKTEHLTSISHEIRTPLNGINGSLELLGQTRLSVKQKDLVETAYNCGNSLLSIINNLLDFSRIEADQIQLNKQVTSILQVIDDAMCTVSARAFHKQIKLQCFLSGNVPEEANFDPVRVRQVLVNLLGNAVKFTDVGLIRLDVKASETSVYFHVTDSGMGIRKQDLSRIFEPFAQTYHQEMGTGLGLPISTRLASFMGGQLSVVSEFQKGSTFTFMLPLEAPSQPICLPYKRVLAPKFLHEQIKQWGAEPIEEALPELENSELNYLPGRLLRVLRELQQGGSLSKEKETPTHFLPWKLKILLVDDVETNRIIIGKMLAELKQDVTLVSSGTEALEKGKRQIFDLVLMDIRMPGLNGYQTTEKWRRDDNILDTECPILALTANAEPTEYQHAIAAGMNDYLTKPVTLEKLGQMLDKVAEMQIDRDITLEIIDETELSIFSVFDDDLKDKLVKELTRMIEQGKRELVEKNWEALADILHQIKGCAGVAGIVDVTNSAQQLEMALVNNGYLSADGLAGLDKLIERLKLL
ncbi:two component system sensor kinase [uncultured Shewanella sp.]|uniref:two component system sensor kinase n=1 Tax=uncultured Shewanella sp. TaxID=173975 RepID=UPI002612EB79|nr:two component system sensor kinase [uncultured Shewanella sp.]